MLKASLSTLSLTLLCSGPLATASPDTIEAEAGPAIAIALPKVTLTSGEIPLDIQAHYKSIAQRAEALANAAVNESDPMKQATALLAAVNLVLAEQLEPALSSFVLGFNPDDPLTPEQISVSIRKVKAWLNQAENQLTLTPQPKDAEKQPADNVAADRLRHHLGILRAFSQSYLALFTEPPDGDKAKALRRAESELAIALEDVDPQVSSAARLWQLCLRSGDPSRRPEGVGDSFPEYSASQHPYAFFEILLRYRLAASSGSHALSAAGLINLEDRAREWLPAEPQRSDAIRAAQFVRLQVLAGWHDKLDAKTQAKEREWCVSKIREISEAAFKPEHAAVARVFPAVPMLVPAPPAPPPPDQPARPD